MQYQVVEKQDKVPVVLYSSSSKELAEEKLYNIKSMKYYETVLMARRKMKEVIVSKEEFLTILDDYYYVSVLN